MGFFALIIGMNTHIQSSESARILAVQTIQAKSHWNFMSAVLGALTENGHSVTVFTSFPDGNRENYTEIDMSALLPNKLNMDLTETRKMLPNQFLSLSFAFHFGRKNCDILYNHKPLNDILANDLNENFDAIIVQPIFSDCFSYITAISKLPLIFVFSCSTTMFSNNVVFDEFRNPAVVSSLMSDHRVPKTFLQRFSNTALWLYKNNVITVQQFIQQIVDPKPYDVINSRIVPSLVFLNSHYISDVPKPIVTNVVNVGGIHLNAVKSIPNVSHK